MVAPYQIPSRKRIPYRMINFADVRESDCYFVDKTLFIPHIEAANKFFFFIRPRRFGKSLTLMMLQHYYDGHWKEYFGYIADSLHRYASQRDKQKGESFVHGFTLALTAQNRFYRPVSEQDTQAGYVDLFLMPRIEVFPDMEHSYILELKYAKRKDSEAVVQQLRKKAIDQALAYAATETVQHSLGTTTLHRIVVVYHGMEMAVCEEV